MRPVGIGLPGPHQPIKPPAKPESPALQQNAVPLAGPVLVQPSDAAGWADWQAGRTQLHHDGADHPALSLYRDIAQGDLRQQLQAMVGVDLYV
ncbi:hypothetical protein KUV89_01450 [Marinobacter hydrocarbonoclasticus]|nr:hypothetical protein [Marinobacter nauticus]